MPEEDELTDAIAENAAGPKSVTIDGFTSTQHSLQDQIEADRYLRGNDAANRKNRGLRFSQISAPGA